MPRTMRCICTAEAMNGCSSGNPLLLLTAGDSDVPAIHADGVLDLAGGPWAWSIDAGEHRRTTQVRRGLCKPCRSINR
jgi:hypothetical protein